jgi:hypothetical protein
VLRAAGGRAGRVALAGLAHRGDHVRLTQYTGEGQPSRTIGVGGAARSGARIEAALHAVGGVPGQPSLPERLRAHGLPTDRVDIVGYVNRREYLAQYGRIDLALDPFPYNGGTTTLDALYMGVPVVALAGTRPVGRAGVTILSALGLHELIATTPEDYVKIAARLAADPSSLAALRSTLRDRLCASPLMDARGHARRLENLYRGMWADWCARRS